MYIGWADGRGMVRRNGADGAVELEVSGLGAYTLLKPEIGLHVLELPRGEERSFDRITVLVDVSPSATAPTGRGRRVPSRVVRRYRREPSPLVRAASGARTGRIDRVLAGDFDLFADVLAGSA